MKLLKGFPYSVLYLILLSSATLYVWSNHLENYGIPIVLGLMFLFFLFSKDTMPTIPLLFNALFMVSTAPTDFESIPVYLYLTPAVLIGGMVLHIIIYRVSIFKGKMLLGIAIMFFAMLLSSMNASNLDIYYFLYASVGLLYALFYMFYRNTLNKDHTAYLLKMMLILGILVSAQIVVYYLGVEDIRFALEHKTIQLGWGISNYIATYLIMFVAVTFYYAKTSKFTFIYLLVAFIEIALIAFTGSRGGMVAFVVMFPVLIFLLFFKSKKKNLTFLSFLLVGDIAFIGIFLNYDFIDSVFFRFENMLFDDTGRYEIYVDAIHKFLEYPIFGGGLFARDASRDFNMFHNTILHTAATLGSVGLIALFIQYFNQFWITIKGFKNESLFLVAALIGANLHGMVDNVYYMPQFMIIMLLIVSVMEVATTIKKQPV